MRLGMVVNFVLAFTLLVPLMLEGLVKHVVMRQTSIRYTQYDPLHELRCSQGFDGESTLAKNDFSIRWESEEMVNAHIG